jgi:glucosamine kinase
MVLIADSGSTKTDWRLLIPGGETQSFSTVGFNPYFHTSQQISEELGKSLIPLMPKDKVPESVFYYGAGCGTRQNAEIVAKALRSKFQGAGVIVDSDLLGAALGLSDNKPGIVAILGTGSNSCLFNGKEIVDNLPSLGFILGDEGSGAQIGKRLVKAYLDRTIPENMRIAFEEKYGMTKEEILDNVYRKPFPNRFLAAFTRFCSTQGHDPYIRELINTSFDEFLELKICKYENWEKLPIHFTGSVGFVFKDILGETLLRRGMNVGQITHSPMEGMIKFHRKTFS